MEIITSDRELMDSFRGNFKKQALKAVQRVYLKYNPDEKYNCMCNAVTRKIKHAQFYEWYDKARVGFLHLN